MRRRSCFRKYDRRLRDLAQMRLTFTPNVSRRLIAAESFERGMPHSAIRCPLAELDFRYPRWLYPVRVLPQPARRRGIKRRSIDLRFLQLPTQIQTEFVAP